MTKDWGKVMSAKDKKYAGFLVLETVAALAILATIMIGLALSLDGFARFNRYLLMKQQCTAAAAAELDSLAVTGKAVGDEDFERLWPGLSVSIEQTQGMGQWEGMKLLEVITSGKSYRRQVSVRLSRYVPVKGSD
jgi:type II secretory pathway pseudopilin PulG